VLALCDYLAALTALPGERPLDPYMEAAVQDVLKGHLLEGSRKTAGDAGFRAETVAAAVAGAVYGVAKDWALAPDRCPAEEAADMAANLVGPMLRLPAH
jgi:hypothetical protein